jgi:hypothetical protein
VDSEANKRLQKFFSAYFHEDWQCDDDNAEAVVRRYLRAASLTETQSLAAAIRAYLESFKNDKELEKDLFNNLGCYYAPSADGLLAKAWLNDLANQLLSKP